MADEDYTPVDPSEDEDERKKRASEYAPVTPGVRTINRTPSKIPMPSTGESAPSPVLSLPGAPVSGGLGDVAAVSPHPVPSGPHRPQWSEYAPAEPHGWGKFGHIMASLNPATNEAFNVGPERRAAESYKNATAEYEAPFKEHQATEQSGLTEAQTEHYRAQTEDILHPNPLLHPQKEGVTPEETTMSEMLRTVNPKTGKPYTRQETYEWLQHTKADATQGSKANPLAKEKAEQLNAIWNTILEKHHLPLNQFKEGMTDADAKEMATNFNNALGKQQGDTHVSIDLGKLQQSKDNASRTDIRDHDKAYVQPAEAVEKSYQMMNNAYNEYKAAKAAGKELPTGAESMVALSTHLSTTFGNVKGARITKDMIEHHLGARSISDSALVAIQKFTNGDVLSPAQWDAFHSLIKQSRDLSWKTAEKEAVRKKIPVDFLPQDIHGGNSDEFKAPDGAPAAPKEDGHKLKQNGKVVAVSKGGQWTAPE